MEPKYIRLGFENVEVIDVETNDIAELLLDGVAECHQIIPGCVDGLKIIKTCQRAEILFEKSADKPYPSDDGLGERTLFKRLLAFRDLTDVAYLDENKEAIGDPIYFPWDPVNEDEAESFCQKTKITKDGELSIVIEKQTEGR